MSGRIREEAVEALLAGGVPASVVQDVDDVFHCPHVAARNMLMTLDDPVWGPVQVVGNPVKMSGAPEAEARLPPRLGEHTADVLKEWLGASDGDIARLRELDVV
jgi:formyl-CoA transferase